MPRPDQFAGPTYRFHGRTSPRDRSRTPVVSPLAAAETVSAEDGVATMRIYDPIDSWGGEWGVSAKEFARALDSLSDDTTEIRLHLNSPGGEVFEALAMLNSLRGHRARVVAVVDGLAASAASFLAVGADEVIMGRNSQLMIHDAWGLCVGNAEDMRDLASRLDQLSDNIAAIYAAKAGGARVDWRAAMLAESWYSDEEAVAAGLADSIAGTEPDDKAAKAAFDLSLFAYAGREQAPTPPLPAAEASEITAPPAPPAPEAPAGEAASGGHAQRRHRHLARKHGFAAR